MGASNSQHKGAVTRFSISQAPYGMSSNPIFREEKSLSFFYQQTNQIASKAPQRNHQSSDLAFLLLGCYEQLNNIPEILETLINTDEKPDDQIITDLNSTFDNNVIFSAIRSFIFKYTSIFSIRYFTPFTENPGKQGYLPNFLMLYSSLTDSLQFLNNQTISKSHLSEIATTLANCTPASAFPPPTPDFVYPQQGRTEFTSRFSICHGICSNGQFLFVLSADSYLQIYPLLNMGAIMPAFTKKLPIPNDRKQSLTANKTHIQIYSSDKLYELQICNVMVDIIQPIIKEAPTNYHCFVSDGIVTARIDHDFTVHLFDSNTTKPIRKIKLHGQKHIPLHPAVPVLFPITDYSLIPITINGSFLGILFRINPLNAVFRVFSLIDGGHIHDEMFVSSDQFYSVITDSFNNCSWAVTLMDNNRLGMRRFYFAGSYDPMLFNFKYKEKKSRHKKAVVQFVNALNRLCIHYIGTQVISKIFLADRMEDFIAFINLFPKFKPFQKPDIFEFLAQIFVVIIDMNIRKHRPNSELRDSLLAIFHVIPHNLAMFLFFNNLSLFLFGYTELAMDLLVNLLSNCKPSDDYLTFALNKLETSEMLAFIPFKKPNGFNQLIPETTEVSPNLPIQSLLLIHQRVLVIATQNYLQAESVIQYDANSGIITALDFLNDYSKSVLSKFNDSITHCTSNDELENSFIMTLFLNFLELLSSLSFYHVIAQILTELFNVILNQISSFVQNRSLDITTNTRLASSVRVFLFTYGKLSATLLKGGTLSDFEKQFAWLIRGNLDIQQDIITSEYNFVDSRISDFAAKEGELMQLIYKKYKPMMNKRLTDEVKELDRITLVSICKHINILDDLFGFKGEISPLLRSALDQMFRIRNEHRNLIQNKQPVNTLVIKCKMLLKMHRQKGGEQLHAKQVGDFVFSKQEPNSIIRIIQQQKIRNHLTILGFGLVETVLKNQTHPLFPEIFTFTLAQIDTFDGLASIMKITDLELDQNTQIQDFFNQILQLIETVPESKLILVSFRFFRDCTIRSEIHNSFLKGILRLFSKRKENYKLFALALSMIPPLDEIPSSLRSVENKSPMEWLLLSEILKKIPCTEKLFKSFEPVFWNSEPYLKRILCRVMYRMLNSPSISNEIIGNELVKIINKIGEVYSNMEDLSNPAEMIWILRRILVEKTHAKPILIEKLLEIKHDNEIMKCGMFALLGSCFETIRPYCNIKYHVNRSTAIQYIAVPTLNQGQYLCYSSPFSLEKPSITIQVNPSVMVYAVPMVTLDADSFTKYDFIISFFEESMKYPFKVSSMFYFQLLSTFLRFPDFQNLITKEMIANLSISPLPFNSIIGTFHQIKSMKHMEIFPTYYGFSQIYYPSSKYVSYLSPQIINTANPFYVSFTSKFPIECYFGIISDNAERYHTRYSVISCPGGVWFPYNNRTVCFSQNPTSIEFQVIPKEYKFVVGEQRFQFPIGLTYRVLIAVPTNLEIKISISDQPENGNNSILLQAPPPEHSPKPVKETKSVSKEEPKMKSKEKRGIFSKKSKKDGEKGKTSRSSSVKINKNDAEKDIDALSRMPFKGSIDDINGEIPEIFSQFFYKEGIPYVSQHGCTFARDGNKLFEVPQEIVDIVKDGKLSSHISSLPELRNIIEPIKCGYKVTQNYCDPPEFIPIHIGFSSFSSHPLINDQIRGLFQTLSMQWMTMCLIRIATFHPELITNIPKLFSMLVVPLEPFSASQFVEKKLPFEIGSCPIWAEGVVTNSLYMSFENEAKAALRSITQLPNFCDIMCKALTNICSSKIMHLLAYPHVNHRYYPPLSYGNTIRMNTRYGILTVNSFTPLIREAGIVREKRQTLPYICTSLPCEFTFSDPQFRYLDYSQFMISPNENSWVFETAFEPLIIIKNILYLISSPSQRRAVKMSLLDCIISQSPLIFPYLADFADQVQLLLPSSPFDKNREYLEKLGVLGGYLKNNNCYSSRIQIFYQDEQRISCQRFCNEISAQFPEFFSIPIPKPQTSIIKVPIAYLDPGAIKKDFASYIRKLRMFSRRYESLQGFPFWEILPLWLRVSGAWMTEDNIHPQDEIDPSCELINNEVMHIKNPSGRPISFRLRITIPHWPSTAMIMQSTTPEFENATFLTSRALSHPFNCEGRDSFLALIDVPAQWHSVRVEFTNVSHSQPPPPELIDISKIHDKFVSEIEDFAVKWTDRDTEELLMLLPRYALHEPSFASVEQIAKTSNLVSSFPMNVVILRALILHHFNYIRSKHLAEVPRSVWESMTMFVSCEDAADAITSSIVCGKDDSFGQFTIDRHAAQRLVNDGRGDPSKSIISQLTYNFEAIGQKHLQCKKRPWKIKFAGEPAIDAGGPTRELMTETASSIFEPTSQIMIPTPNGRRDAGAFKETFIPFTRARRSDEYTTIGTFLGIVLRTGLSQDLPFAPLVWKYLAKEKIGITDILQLDDALNEHFKHIKELEENDYVQWNCEQWDGTLMVLPGHAPGTFVKNEEIEQYINECIQFRISSIKAPLKKIRRGFQLNVGFKKHPLLTGALLSRMAQGSSVIATEHLKAITVVTDFEGINDPHVVRFWKAVDRFNAEQRKLLLKFITTLTRLPNSTINPDFRIQIDKMPSRCPDQALPTASTCFNRLHLPAYTDDEVCYQKLLYAIQFCQTMENK